MKCPHCGLYLAKSEWLGGGVFEFFCEKCNLAFRTKKFWDEKKSQETFVVQEEIACETKKEG